MKLSLDEAMKAAAGDRRVFRRYPVSLAVLVRRVVDGEPSSWERTRRCPTISAFVTDLSLSGLIFVSARPQAPGSQLEIQFSLGAEVYSIRAVVKRSQVLWLPGRRTFQCAAQFARSESAARFIPFMAKYLHRCGGSLSRLR